jgi:hypothetical protein
VKQSWAHYKCRNVWQLKCGVTLKLIWPIPRYQTLRKGTEASGTVVTAVFSGSNAESLCRCSKSRCAASSRTSVYPQTHYLALPETYTVFRVEFKMAIQVLHSKKLVHQLCVLRCCESKYGERSKSVQYFDNDGVENVLFSKRK